MRHHRIADRAALPIPEAGKPLALAVAAAYPDHPETAVALVRYGYVSRAGAGSVTAFARFALLSRRVVSRRTKDGPYTAAQLIRIGHLAATWEAARRRNVKPSHVWADCGWSDLFSMSNTLHRLTGHRLTSAGFGVGPFNVGLFDFPKVGAVTLEDREAGTCPRCQSFEIEGAAVNIDGATATQEAWCLRCESEWVDVYRLTRSHLHAVPAVEVAS